MNFLELKIPPPAVALILGVMMWFTPPLLGTMDVPPGFRIAAAIAFVLVGQIISISGMVEFRRAKTTINPVRASAASSLVTGGIYRFTRNPMYVGLLLTLVGWAAYLPNPVTFLFAALFVLYINRFQIKPEERVLTTLFGAPYVAYMGNVRRWI
jgi:protein-S-isoprenylcysteine O-methyltransferase Ste14